MSYRVCNAQALKSAEWKPDYGEADRAEITTAQINPLAERARHTPDELSFDAEIGHTVAEQNDQPNHCPSHQSTCPSSALF
jgi:hypothetical protein